MVTGFDLNKMTTEVSLANEGVLKLDSTLGLDVLCEKNPEKAIIKKKEGNVLFKDTRLNGVGYTVKDQPYSERGNPLPPLHGLLFPTSRKGSFICTIAQTG